MFRKLSVLNKIVYIFNFVFALALLVSCLAWLIPPHLFPFMALFGLGYPVLVVVNLVFVIYWLLFWKRAFMMSAICIVVSYFQFSSTFQLNGRNKVFQKEEALTVMTYNVKAFDNNQSYFKGNNSLRFKNLFVAQDPDILCFQEYYNNYHTPKLKIPYYHYATRNRKNRLMLFIYSKWPIVNKAKVEYSENAFPYGFFIYADIVKGQDTIRVFNVHLISNYINPKEYQKLRTFQGDESEIREEALNLSQRIMKYSAIRSKMADDVRKAVDESPYPVILCGDFNDSPSSYTYSRLQGNLKDSFRESGSGLGNTYSRIPVPLRIDYIMHSKNLKSYNHRVLDNLYSDHFPVMAEIVL